MNCFDCKEVEKSYDRGYADGSRDEHAHNEQMAAIWVHDGSMWENRFFCSNCGTDIFEPKAKNIYCKICGAKMKNAI